jgi:hypothetical protein
LKPMALTPALLELFGSAYEIKEQGGQAFAHFKRCLCCG